MSDVYTGACAVCNAASKASVTLHGTCVCDCDVQMRTNVWVVLASLLISLCQLSLSVRLQIVPPQKNAQKKMENMHRELLQKCAVIQENCAKIVPMFYSAIFIGDRDE